jgi:hypothetical protein
MFSVFSGFWMFPKGRARNFAQLYVVGTEEEKCVVYVPLRPCGAGKASKVKKVEYVNKINTTLLRFSKRASPGKGEQAWFLARLARSCSFPESE